jgi:predicted transcriptional regulator
MSRPVRVRDRMRPGAVAVAWDDSAEAAFARMRSARLDALPVVNDQRVIGLLERDATLACECGGNRLGSVQVASLMRRGVFVCRADDPLGRALATMDRLEVDRLAVLDDAGRVVGVLGRDGDDDPMRRLVPAFYGAY